MILAVCLSPCIDVNIEVETLNVGKSQKIIDKRIFYTGKAINAAIAGARLGAEMFVTGFMYEENGKQYQYELHDEHVSDRFVWCDGRVRENYKFIDHKSMLTEVDDVGEPVPQDKQDELVKLVKDLSKRSEAVILSGGLARDMKPSYYGRIMAEVPDGTIKVVDSEGDRLLEALKVGADLVKPNLDEFQRTLKRKFDTMDEMKAGCRELIAKGAKIVLLSLGKDGALICDESESYYTRSINVAMNSTIGAGDAMTAAATIALCKRMPLADVLKCGVAAGTAAVTSSESISLSKSKYDEILSGLVVESV